MTRWVGLAITVAIAAAPCTCLAESVAKPDAAARASDISARRHARHQEIAHRSLPYEPRYYARPVYYRPFPYSVSTPFVFGFGPWW
jgi:hypothetical protein